MKSIFKKLILALVIVLLLLLVRPVFFLGRFYMNDHKLTKKDKPGFSGDASGLNETKVDTVIKVANGFDNAVRQVATLVRTAKAQHRGLTIAGARHSMGGHTLYRDGIVLDMTGFNEMKLESNGDVLQVGAGALWSQVITYLSQRGKSVAVMQSNNSFSTGGSVSVNCHGWQSDSPPIAATVLSLRLINASGELLNCSRTENAELFSLVLGGYGLFGVIIDLRLKVVDNKVYTAKQYIIKSEDYVREFRKYASGRPEVEMVYGRINVNPSHFMEEAILSVYQVSDQQMVTGTDGFSTFKRTLFRASANSDYGKELRWDVEKMATHLVNGRHFSRNQLLGEGVEVFQNSDSLYTDILHEYFVPADSLAHFIKAVQQIVPQYEADLLNITLRNVKTDHDSYLAYAHDEVFGMVMLFNQKKDKEAEQVMKRLTQRLIDAAVSAGGSYYLPYRLHASKQQLYRAYPKAKDFFLLKNKYDPASVFRNQFYDMYRP